MIFFIKIIIFATNLSFIFAALTNHLVPEGKVIGGHEAVPHSHPYLVSLQIKFLWVRTHLCGGSILNERWVLTAGHCVKGSWLLDWLALEAIAGAHNVDKPESYAQIVKIERRVPHPYYLGDVGPHDIAVLKTKEPIKFSNRIQPIRLPANDKVANDDSLKLAGWGVLKTYFFIPVIPSKLHEVTVTYVPYKECYQAVEDIRDPGEPNPLNKEANICSGPLTGGIAGCNGDSGGPLVQYISDKINEIPTDETVNDVASNETESVKAIEDNQVNEIVINQNISINFIRSRSVTGNNNIPVILGVVSWGATPCGEEGAPTVYTKVSQYLDFINQHIHS